MKGKRVFEQEFSLCQNSSKEIDLKISNSNSIISNIEEKENKDNISNADDKENKKILLDDDNILLTLPQEAIYKPLKTEYIDKSCQFYSDFQNSEQDLNIAIEENDKNEKDKIEEKKEKKNEEKEKEKEKEKK